MFCPDCGQAEQVAGKYCRGCGTYLSVQSLWSERRYSPRTTLGVVVAGLALGILFMVASFGAHFILKPGQHLSNILLGGVFGFLLGSFWNALRLYLRMGSTRTAAPAKELEQASAAALQPTGTAQIVNAVSVTEVTTALLEKVRDTQRS